ncbi:MAG: hypothetical protein GWN58_54100, partial [Anaerolineae bacterium]|nr:hypothetical protein [Anaerolineae bacterium]
ILEALVALLNDRKLPVKLLIVLREDYLAQLTPLFERCPTLVDQYLRLTPLDGEQVLRTIRGPFDEFPGHYQPEISADLARTIREQFEERSQGAGIRLTEVQIVCESLSKSPDPDRTFAEHKNVQGILDLEEYLKGALASLPIDQQEPAVELLTRMVTSAGTRKRISQDDLLAQVRREGFPRGIAIATLDSLEQRAKLVRREPLRNVHYYEIASEFLVSWIHKQADIRRLHRAEEKAAKAGRMEEQERRIFSALESMKSLEQVNRRLREANLRMRILLGVLAIVCLAAAVAAVFAFVQKGEADAARNTAVAAATAAAESLQVAQDSLATQEAGLIGQLQ